VHHTTHEERAQRDFHDGLDSGAAGVLYRTVNIDELTRSLGRLDHIAGAQQSLLTDGTGAGMRSIEIRMWDGVQVQILPDRGFDIGPAWYRGVPVAWASRLGYRPALSPPLSGTDWITAFGGGLVTTCGLFNVGSPSEGQGMHGNFSHLPADDISVTRNLDSDGQVTLKASATIREGSALGPLLELKRIWTFRTGEGVVELSDVVTNLGAEETPAPVLYHVNFGSPFWRRGASLEGPGGQILPRDNHAAVGLPVWDRAPEPEAHLPEWAFEHVLPQTGSRWARFTINSPDTGVRCVVAWDTSTLPRVHQWIHPASTINALGIEPCNCTIRGRTIDREEGRMPTLAPDESRMTRLRITFSPYP
jgi:hypothetical protein